MKKTFRCLIFLILMGSFFPLFSQSNLRLYLDYARFRYDARDTYLEIYYLLYDARSSAAQQARDVWLDFELSDTERDSVLADTRLKVTLEPNSSGDSGLKGSLIKTVLVPGKYQIKVSRTDETGIVADSISYQFATPSFVDERIRLSDIELCSNIVTGSRRKDALFYKNTMEVYPNPTHIYGRENSSLYYYVELYNIRRAVDSENIEIHVAIKDSHGNVYDERRYKRGRNYESLVEKGRFDISRLENGFYTLIFAAIDSSATAVYSTFKINNFYVINQGQGQEGLADAMSLFPRSPYFTMPEDKVDLRFAQARYIANKDEVNIYQTLTSVESKRVFMFKFWYEREQDQPGLQEEYYRRAAYADENFKFANRAGWDSDMGRIYIKYGAPDETVIRPVGRENKPFEIWTYHNLEGGAKFLFIDETGFKDYKMVSSTYRTEIYDPIYDSYFQFID